MAKDGQVLVAAQHQDLSLRGRQALQPAGDDQREHSIPLAASSMSLSWTCCTPSTPYVGASRGYRDDVAEDQRMASGTVTTNRAGPVLPTVEGRASSEVRRSTTFSG